MPFKSYRNWLMENENNIWDIAITLPSTISWDTYKKELETVTPIPMKGFRGFRYIK